MANGTADAPVPSLSFPRATFAKLTPGPFLLAHLKQDTPTRPSGRTPDEFRQPSINTGSLTNSDGSAVVRVGDTAIVCGVRAEILLASDIPHPPRKDLDADDTVAELGLLVPNFELSTGCSPAHLPGNPPSTLAQALSYRLLSLLHTSHLVQPTDLKIQYTEPATDEEIPDEGPQVVTKAYWTLYIDILCIALDGNPFDAAWSAVLAALQNTALPNAWWDPDREQILCSPEPAEAHKLRFNELPISSTFAVFSMESPMKRPDQAQHWVLADPDGFEEDVCKESLTIVVNGKGGILKIEKSGGAFLGREAMKRCGHIAEQRWKAWNEVLSGG